MLMHTVDMDCRQRDKPNLAGLHNPTVDPHKMQDCLNNRRFIYNATCMHLSVVLLFHWYTPCDTVALPGNPVYVINVMYTQEATV